MRHLAPEATTGAWLREPSSPERERWEWLTCFQVGGHVLVYCVDKPGGAAAYLPGCMVARR